MRRAAFVLAGLAVFVALVLQVASSTQVVQAQDVAPDTPYPSTLTYDQCPYHDCTSCTERWAKVGVYIGHTAEDFYPAVEKTGDVYAHVFWDFVEFADSGSWAEICRGGTCFEEYKFPGNRLGEFYAFPGANYKVITNPQLRDIASEAKVWWFEGCDATPPTFTLGPTSGFDSQGRSFFQVTVQDSGSGLWSLTYASDPYCPSCTIVNLPEFSPGTHDPVIVTVTESPGAAPGGYYGITLNAADMMDNAGTWGKWVDRTPPLCGWDACGLNQCTGVVRDAGFPNSGLRSIVLDTTRSFNCALSSGDFVPGATDPVSVRVDRVDLSKPSWRCAVNVTDITGNSQSCKPPIVVDRTSPTCEWRDLSGGDVCVGIVRDAGSGIASIQWLIDKSPNACVLAPTLTDPGTSLPVITSPCPTGESNSSWALGGAAVAFIQGYKLPPTAGWWDYTLGVRDAAGNYQECDPIVTISIRQGGAPSTRELTGVPQAASKVKISNGTPGLTNLGVEVNGRRFEVAGLKDSEIRNIDVSAVMVPGNNNKITLAALGKPGSSATVMISD